MKIHFICSYIAASATTDGLPKLMEGLVIAVEKKSDDISDILDSLVTQIQTSGSSKLSLFYSKIVFHRTSY
jgi:hypothetical protein